jgi:tRNA (guanine10-N2)-methyltransferase
LWGSGETYEQVHQQVKTTSDRWALYKQSSFKFVVSAFASTIDKHKQLDIINSFSYLGFEGNIDMKKPQVQFHVLADYGGDNGFYNKTPRQQPLYIYMGRLVNSLNKKTVFMRKENSI